ncbi:hypothetical protein NDU88_001262 [Pleurodeles waltl]|uniref:Uncharacterized protein n=1 Tax=Pleurodeles waltl TaxID=8319 RepID=A0AAV7S6Y0_PLEWA|nr:hypothetical protein NDU88_001262 [Pleurodeles waltl]
MAQPCSSRSVASTPSHCPPSALCFEANSRGQQNGPLIEEGGDCLTIKLSGLHWAHARFGDCGKSFKAGPMPT